ncbi:MAG: transcriptional regulator FleQ [Gammaproteobacteria bacterium]|nr:MAG: transcriptional regulator FleQ [Gammaproteobacteria bacterium]
MSTVGSPLEQQTGDESSGQHTDHEMPSTILVICDDADKKEYMQTILDFVEAGPLVMTDSNSWHEHLKTPSSFLAVVQGDCNTPEVLGEVLEGVNKLDPDLPVILVAKKSIRNSLTNEQAYHVLYHLDDEIHYDELTSILNKCRIYRESRREVINSQSERLFRSLAGNSKSIQHVRTLMEQVAGSDANVLILGESGTGKEVVARNLHYHSSRREKPFVPINCGAIPPDLLESELFGHEKGAFTGAITTRQGRFELAEGGSLFLDEIGDMPLSMQVKLLRVLQERTFERVGSNKSIKTNVRIIAATHRNLEDLIKQGTFREDLYYRLNVFPIEMPPLRERITDIPILINELITRFEHEKRGSVRLTPSSVLSLSQYPWLGNVRELANLIERLVIMFPYGVVDVTDLPEKFRIPGVEAAMPPEMDDGQSYNSPPGMSRIPKDGLDLKEYMSNLECSYIKQSLDESRGVVAHAAKLLRMRRTTLVEKMRKYGLQRNEDTTNF